MEALIPVRRIMSFPAYKKMRADVMNAADDWDTIQDDLNKDAEDHEEYEEKAEEVFQDQQARIVELESQRNGKKKAKRI